MLLHFLLVVAVDLAASFLIKGVCLWLMLGRPMVVVSKVTSSWTKPLPPSALCKYSLPTFSFWVVHLFHGQHFSRFGVQSLDDAQFPVDDVKPVRHYRYGQGVYSFESVGCIEFALQDHSHSSVVLFPDLFHHGGVLNAISFIHSYKLACAFLFNLLDLMLMLNP